MRDRGVGGQRIVIVANYGTQRVRDTGLALKGYKKDFHLITPIKKA
jgi:3D (Asp-Asp-Asp) domain-containing protein